MRLAERVKDERGTTLMELMVGLAAGSVILLAVTMMIITSLHQTARVSARVDATQRARITLTRVLEELHSACVAPQIAPVKAGSSDVLLNFVHQAGTGAILTPVRSEISLSEGTLKQADYEALPGSGPPEWAWAVRPFSERQLMTGISPTAPSSPIFSYYAYSNGQISSTRMTVPIVAETAPSVVQVNVAFTAAPASSPVADAGAAASIKGSALLRLTPASYNKEVVSPPCQ